jgi:hypothetical protein
VRNLFGTLPRWTSALALSWIVCAAPAAASETRLKLYGSIVGFVTGPGGAAQMGATVMLLNRFDQPVHRTFTNDRGAFGFDALLPDLYSVRVLQTSFAPASKQGVRVEPGARSFLSIQLASFVSSIQLFYAAPGAGSLMTDDWKWVLRSGNSSRPVLRVASVPKVRIDDPAENRTDRPPSVFSETRGMLSLMAGETGNAQAASIADMGTAFALSTSLFGSSQVLFSGNVGYSPANGVPAAGFRTVYRRPNEAALINPEVKLTVQQVFLPLAGLQRAQSSVTSMSTGLADEIRLTKHLSAEVGLSLDSVSYLNRISYFSPYAIGTWDGEEWGTFQVAFSSGIPPVDLVGRRGESRYREAGDRDLNQNVSALALMPRITMRGGAARIQRSQNYEVSYSKKFGSRTVSAGLFREGLTNAALTMTGAGGGFLENDTLPDFNSSSAVFNIGDLSRTGFVVSGAQAFGEWMTVALMFSRGGVLRTDQYTLASDDPDEIRNAIRRSNQNAISAQMSGSAPVTGTNYRISYQWTDYRALTPGHHFMTSIASPGAGLNIQIRQRLPAPSFLGSRMELTAELRNALAQGYLPLTTPDGRRLLLIHTPKALRGGVAFFF